MGDGSNFETLAILAGLGMLLFALRDQPKAPAPVTTLEGSGAGLVARSPVQTLFDNGASALDKVISGIAFSDDSADTQALTALSSAAAPPPVAPTSPPLTAANFPPMGSFGGPLFPNQPRAAAQGEVFLPNVNQGRGGFFRDPSFVDPNVAVDI